jgi:hypothetical protein
VRSRHGKKRIKIFFDEPIALLVGEEHMARRLLAVMLFTILTSAPVYSGIRRVGDWYSGANNGGHEFYGTSNVSRDRFFLNCYDKAEASYGATMSIYINAAPAPANSFVTLEIDGSKSRLPTDADGEVRSDDHLSAQAFESTWNEIRSGSQMIITFSDGRTARFSLKGSGSIVPLQNCQTTFERLAAQVRAGKDKPQSNENLSLNARIRAKCKNDWPDDFEMELFCVKQQTKAARELGY